MRKPILGPSIVFAVLFITLILGAPRQSLVFAQLETDMDVSESSTKSEVSNYVVVASPIVYRVRSGDGLERIARRFGVTVADLRSADINPKLAARKNLNLLYKGETITIPVYKTEVREANAVKDYEVVMLPKSELIAAAALKTALRESTKNEGLKRSVLAFRATLLILFVVTVAGLLIRYFYIKFQLIPENDDKHRTPLGMPLENYGPQELLDLIKTARWQTVVAMNDLSLAQDERGNSVTAKKAREFTEKRSYLLNVRIWETQEAMDKKKMADQTTVQPV